MKQRSESTAGSDASSSPESVNDSMKGDPPAVAASSPAVTAVILPRASRRVSSIVAATTSAAITAAAARIANGEPPIKWRARKTSMRPCGRSTQAPP